MVPPSERPAASLGCGGDAEESELAIVQILLGLVPCVVGASYDLSRCERRRRESGPVGLATTASLVALVVLFGPSVGVCLQPDIRPVDDLTMIVTLSI